MITEMLANPETSIPSRVDVRLKKIGLLDHMGFGNMGDAAIHESFVQNIKKRLPNALLVAFSQNPNDTRRRHTIESFPINWDCAGSIDSEKQRASKGTVSELRSLFSGFRVVHGIGRRVYRFCKELAHLWRSFRVVRSLDLLIISGGGQLCDLWWSQPYNVFKFCVLGKLARTPVFIVGVGADLIRARRSRFFARWAVQLATYASFRDAESQALIRSLGVKKETYVCPDPAYGLDLRDYKLSHPSKAARAKVGLNPMGFCDPRTWPRQDEKVYNNYLDKLAEFSLWLLAQNYDLELFTSDIGIDKYAIHDLMERVLVRTSAHLSARVVCRPMLDLGQLLRQMTAFDFVVTPKFHGVVFSHLLKKPVIALSYLPKIDYLMRRTGRNHYCMSIEEFDLKVLMDKFTLLVHEKEKAEDMCHETSMLYANAVGAEFDNALSTEMCGRHS
jgi:polysaccharide pyruvyl transferase WcaK-like protein